MWQYSIVQIQDRRGYLAKKKTLRNILKEKKERKKRTDLLLSIGHQIEKGNLIENKNAGRKTVKKIIGTKKKSLP